MSNRMSFRKAYKGEFKNFCLRFLWGREVSVYKRSHIITLFPYHTNSSLESLIYKGLGGADIYTSRNFRPRLTRAPEKSFLTRSTHRND